MSAGLELKTDVDEQTVLRDERQDLFFGAIPPTRDATEALQLGQLDYELETFQLKPVITGKEAVEIDPEYIIDDYKGVRRKDIPTAVFHVPRYSYTIVQNKTLFESLEKIIKTSDTLEFTRVGSFRKGATIFAFISDRDQLGLDELKFQTHVIFQSAHDGTGCIKFSLAITTGNGIVVKQNPDVISYRHTKFIELTDSDINKILLMKQDFTLRFFEDAYAFSRVPMTPEEGQEWLKYYLSYSDGKKIQRTYKQKLQDDMYKVFLKQTYFPQTRLAMALAVADYRMNEAIPRRMSKDKEVQEVRFESVIKGTSAKKIAQAWELLSPK